MSSNDQEDNDQVLRDKFKEYFDFEVSVPCLRNFAKYDMGFFIAHCNFQDSEFQTKWMRKFKMYADLHGIQRFTKHQPNWRMIESRAHQKDQPSPQSATSSSTKKSSMPVSSSFMKFVKDQHKNLKAEKWILTTGTCVEDKVLEFALACRNEHACHALIIDVNDPAWSDYFKPEELNEIGTFNLSSLPKLSEKVSRHLDSFYPYDNGKNPNGKTVEDLLRFKVNNSELDLVDDFDLMWINNSIGSAMDLYRWGYFPITTHTEGDLLRRVWSFLERCLDNAKIQTRGGEKTSTASADRRNERRNIAGAEAMARKALGRRGDLIFSRSKWELGCGELGRRDDGSKGSKELRESFLKTPKMMKDELAALISHRPDKAAQFKTVGFISMGLTLQLLTMDCPKGNICRVRRTARFEFPEYVEEFQENVLPMYEMVLKAKAIMVGNIHILQSPQQNHQAVDYRPVLQSDFRLPPCPPSPHSYKGSLPSSSSASASSSDTPQKRSSDNIS